MRRPVLALVLIGLGCFLISAGLLARYYVFPHVAVLPLDRFEKTESRAQNATYVDQSTGVQQTGRELIAINTLRGDVEASYPDTVVWESLTWTRDAESGADVNFYETVVAMDRHTGEALNCCGHSIEKVQYLPRSGLAYQWPFFSEKTTYQYYDEPLRKTYPMRYQATEKLFGLTVYRYEQRIEPTLLAPQSVPAFLVKKPGNGMVDAERWYAVDRTFWVEPRSGIVVRAGNHRVETLRVDGVDALTVFDADMLLSEKDSRRIIAEASDARTQIGLLYNGAFWAGLLLGVLFVLLGLVVALRRPRPERADDLDLADIGGPTPRLGTPQPDPVGPAPRHGEPEPGVPVARGSDARPDAERSSPRVP